MTHHPHLHMIVPGGGISLDGTHWVHCRPGFLLPVRVLSRLFRRLFLTRLADAHAAGRLAFSRRGRGPARPDGLRRPSRAAATQGLVRLCQTALRRARGGARLSRPLHPPCRHLEQPANRPRRARRDLPLQGLPPQRAGAISHDDAGAPRVHQALSAPRPARGFHRIRHYGLLASAGCKANIARAIELIAAPAPPKETPAEHDNASTTGIGADHRPPCPCCGGRMIIIETFERCGAPRAPPSSDAGVRSATP